MGVVFDYFSAPDDASAASTWPTGPFPVGFDAVDVTVIDPAVLVRRLLALLLDRPYDEITRQPGYSRLVTDPGAEGCRVVALTDDLRDALAGAGDDRLAAVVVPWLTAAEFGPLADPRPVRDFLTRMANLSRRAQAAGDGLYCWISL